MGKKDDLGTLALIGGGEWLGGGEDFDRELLARVDHSEVVVLPTADAYEQPQVLVDAALAWGARIGVIVEPLMLLTRAQADDDAAAVIAAAPAVFLAGDSANHLRSEESAGHAEALLGTATTRIRWASSHFAFALAGVTVLLLVAGVAQIIDISFSAYSVPVAVPVAVLLLLRALQACLV